MQVLETWGEEGQNDEKKEFECDADTKQFIKKYKLNDIAPHIISSQIRPEHLIFMRKNGDANDGINELCAEWNLKPSQKIRFKFAVASVCNQNINGGHHDEKRD